MAGKVKVIPPENGPMSITDKNRRSSKEWKKFAKVLRQAGINPDDYNQRKVEEHANRKRRQPERRR